MRRRAILLQFGLSLLLHLGQMAASSPLTVTTKASHQSTLPHGALRTSSKRRADATAMDQSGLQHATKHEGTDQRRLRLFGDERPLRIVRFLRDAGDAGITGALSSRYVWAYLLLRDQILAHFAIPRRLVRLSHPSTSPSHFVTHSRILCPAQCAMGAKQRERAAVSKLLCLMRILRPFTQRVAQPPSRDKEPHAFIRGNPPAPPPVCAASLSRLVGDFFCF